MKREIVRFAAAGVLGFAVDAAALYAALALGAGYFAGRACSFLLAVWTTWQFNRRFTFAGGRRASAWAEWWRYLLAMSAGGLANLAAYALTVLMLPKAPWLPLFAVAVGSGAGMCLNFATAKWWVFRGSGRTTG
jgi:putative flippase GtrA